VSELDYPQKVQTGILHRPYQFGELLELKSNKQNTRMIVPLVEAGAAEDLVE
jgi:hypothetical protein